MIPNAFRALSLSLVLALPSFATEAPVAHWSFDGASPAERLTESYGITAWNATTVGTAPTWEARSGFGDVLNIGAGTNYLSVPSAAADFGSSSFTISLWLHRTSDNGTSSGIVDALSGSAITGFQWFFQGSNSMRVRLDDTDGNNVIFDTSASQLNLNSWQHYALVIDRSTNRGRIYRNGVEVTTAGGANIAALTGALTPDQNFWIGSFNGTDSAKGKIDDVALFDRALSPAEIASLSANGGQPILSIWPKAPPTTLSANLPSGFVASGSSLSLSADPPDAEIRYTTDGTAPTSSSPLYTAPIPVTEALTLQAQAFPTTGNPSPVLARNYLLRPSSLPNVVIVVGDNIGVSDVQSFGGPGLIRTPHLDDIAYDGVRFTQFSTAGPGNIESQYALLTGRVAARSGMPISIPAGSSGIDSEEWTLAEMLRKQGYETAFIGQWYLGDAPGSHPNDQGFSKFYGRTIGNGVASALFNNRETVSPAPSEAQLLQDLTAEAQSFIGSNANKPFTLVFQPSSLPATGTSLAGDYGNRVEAFDQAVGQILDSLEQNGLTSNTIVLFVSDEGAAVAPVGASQGTNGMFRDGATTTWEGGVRTPCAIRWPAFIPAARNGIAPLWICDFFPALRNLTQGHLPSNRVIDGTNRSDAIFGQRIDPIGDEVLTTYRTIQGVRTLATLRQGQWKMHLNYVNTDPENTTSTAAPLLFQVEEDFNERLNRSTDQGVVVSSLQSLATATTATLPVPGSNDLPAPKQPMAQVNTPSVNPTSTGFVFQRPLDALNDQYQIERSTNLTTWTPMPIAPFINAATPVGADLEEISLSIPWNTPELGGTQHFIRLKALRPTQP